ncbi:MAG: GNAT family N-acetyltransferase [Bacillus sp. (in: firmicutes)]
MKITIDQAKPEDYETVDSIVKEGHAQTSSHMLATINRGMPPDVYEKLLMEADSDILLAKYDDEIVGLIILQLKESGCAIPMKYVHMSEYGTVYMAGDIIGKQLFSACIEWAKAKGATSLELNVSESNEKAILFYESLDMETVSRNMSMIINE